MDGNGDLDDPVALIIASLFEASGQLRNQMDCDMLMALTRALYL